MSADRTSMRVWSIVASGGRWTFADIRKELPAITSNHIRRAVESMALAGALKEYEGGTYGVTHECTIPRGITLRELLAIVRD